MIILTGASGGIGREIIPSLLEIDRVIGLYNTTVPQTTADQRLILEQLDLEDPLKIKNFMDKWKDRLSRITVIHLAAAKIDGLATNYPAGDWDRVMNVNLKGDFLLTQALLPRMIQEQWGRIIHISSRGALEGAVGTAAYSTSKAGLLGLSRVLAKEYARFNVTSNVLVLGHFEVGLYSQLSEDVKKQLLNQVPSKTLGKVPDIFGAIKFLIGAPYVNGAAINIDGGI